ncbi:MAG: hypothetical protein HYT80_06270 [Euryarchaeota archaeon]|nr:hypothetical protein [Euryarchaeota archaeon]
MSTKARRILLGLMITATCAWALVTLFVFVATNGVPVGWLLATIILYAALFVFALLLLFLAVPETAPAAAPGPTAMARTGPDHETVFTTRRGAVEIDRSHGNVAEVVVSEPGRPLYVDQAEAALDRLHPTGAEARPPPPPETPPSATSRPRPSSAPTGREAVA